MSGGEQTVLGDSTKLSGVSNYSVWKFRIRTILQKEDLWDVVVPNSGQNGVLTVNIGGDATSNAEAERIHARRMQKALAILCLSVRDEIIPHIGDEQDPAVVWRTIKSLYETNTIFVILRDFQ
jgi:hypothetical protein